jgi:hypothetical protein
VRELWVLKAAFASVDGAAAATDKCSVGRVEGVSVEGGIPERDSDLEFRKVREDRR